MVRRHVYSDPSWLAGDSLQRKLAVPRAKGARHVSIRFVTSKLDRRHSRSEWLGLASSIGVPHLVVYGGEMPRQSLAEIETLAVLPRFEAIKLSKGKLSVYEEFADRVADVVLPFLARQQTSTS